MKRLRPRLVKNDNFEESFFEVAERLESSIEGSKTKVLASKSLKLKKIGAAAHFLEPAARGDGGAAG